MATDIYRTLAEQIENDCASMAVTRAEDSVEFLKKALEVARAAVASREAGSRRQNSTQQPKPCSTPTSAHSPRSSNSTSPQSTPVIVDDVVRDIDTIVKQVSFTGWTENQDGDRSRPQGTAARCLQQVRACPSPDSLFDTAYAYIRENY
ncbi:MAG: hypothetical protein V9G09_11230 [Candidatus Nanopelagicales bacterium]